MFFCCFIVSCFCCCVAVVEQICSGVSECQSHIVRSGPRSCKIYPVSFLARWRKGDQNQVLVSSGLVLYILAVFTARRVCVVRTVLWQDESVRHTPVVCPNGQTYQHTFCRVMLCKRGLCRRAVSVCLSVRHVREFCQNE